MNFLEKLFLFELFYKDEDECEFFGSFGVIVGLFYGRVNGVIEVV